MNTNLLIKERIGTIDCIRGFALLGIFMVNLPNMLGIFTPLKEEVTINQWVEIFFNLFISDKFFVLFSFLFGLSFFIFMSRAEAKGYGKKLFARRLLFLLLFGIIHRLFFWAGDVLLLYAITGYFLLFFYNRKPKTILVWGVLLISAFIILVHGLIGFMVLNAPSLLDGFFHKEAQIEAYHTLGYIDWLIWHFNAEVIPETPQNLLIIPLLLGIFLLGLYTGKIGVFQRIEQFIKPLKKIQAASCLASIPFIGLLYYCRVAEDPIALIKAFETLYLQAGGIILSAFYMTTLMILLRVSLAQKILSPLRLYGQMALTNYLTQTLIGFVIFFTMRLYGSIELYESALICIVVFITQIIFSNLWLKNFRLGPFEWIWRTLTYGKRQELLKNK
ncbi:DUF418 domain-containing protein [Peribacillus simplex]|uniref:DUF418 domain-containing protein n=1 Tax=Peribacillus simplex TaxID=1478 RepID=UPI003D270CA4